MTGVAIASLAGAYLVGSIPFGLLLGLARGVDIRLHGSGNIGATNAMRVLGKRIGALCFALDVAKGFAPTLLAGWALGAFGAAPLTPGIAWLWVGVACATVAGHMFPVWLRFRGGKGVATGLGAMLAVWPHLTIPAALAAVAWVIAARATRYVGLSSCIAGVSVPVWACLTALARGGWSVEALRGAWPFIAATALLAGVVVWRHRGNIARTLAGTEPRIGERAGAQSSENRG